jgi:hypothetical protein
MHRSITLAIALVLLANVAAAEPRPSPKSRKLAAALSLAGSVAPYVLFAPAAGSEHPSRAATDLAWMGGAMLVVMPSAGHWYAGEVWSTGLAVRIAGAAMIGASLWEIHRDHGSPSPLDAVPIAAGGLLVLVGQAVDVGTSEPAVDRWNRAHVDVMPMLMPVGDGYGAGVVGRF